MSEKELIDSIKTKLLALRVDTLDKQVEKCNDVLDKMMEKLYIMDNKVSVLSEEHNSRKDKFKIIVYPLIVALLINLPTLLKLFLKGS